MTREMDSLGFLPMPNADRTLVHNMRVLEKHMVERSNPVGGQDSIQAAAGGQELEVTATHSISTADPTKDSRVLHRLRRKPVALVWYKPLDDPRDLLYGMPDGGQGTNAGNQTPWDDKAVYVRSNREGARFVFVVT